MDGGDKQEPGQIIKPGDHSSRESDQPAKQPPPAKPAATPIWQFNAEAEAKATSSSKQPTSLGETVSWTASEFVHHEKPTSWYSMLGLGGIVLAAVVYLLTRDWISTVAMLVVAVVFGVFAARKPRVLTYQLDNAGLQIGSKFYPYEQFKSFAVMDEGGINSISLMPLRRFMPLLTIYYAPENEDEIMNALASFLPFEEREHDVVDKLMRRLRF